LAVKISIGASGVVMLWYFAFELLQESKFTYNTWHPYISFLPIAAFVVLRNANVILRSTTSRAFAFIGSCSLETFIIQFHFWLAADTKGLLVVLPAIHWRSVNFVITTVMFIYVSHRVAQATGTITSWICVGEQKTQPALPTAATEVIPLSSSSSRRQGGPLDNVPLASQIDSKDSNPLPPEPDTPIRPTRRWVDRLTNTASTEGNQTQMPGFRVWYGEKEWNPGLGTKVLLGMGLMWLVNILWTYP